MGKPWQLKIREAEQNKKEQVKEGAAENKYLVKVIHMVEFAPSVVVTGCSYTSCPVALSRLLRL